ncbi:hypothetical protein LMTR13_20195 [Bradyrhizobium icense]|uniref:Cation-transporting P-type ATPase N-terminal domain-containing protein n=1 Tax=Bradyrhizobium icense TaxID=1274631 RepID=A0A1B1UHB2_9BRAD|nr:hypothetical protein LMTR13_20195 [Bradyrhizobium icense]
MKSGQQFRGLSEADAAARLQAEGHNELPQPDRRTPIRIAIEVLHEPILVAFATMSIVITAAPADAAACDGSNG